MSIVESQLYFLFCFRVALRNFTLWNKIQPRSWQGWVRATAVSKKLCRYYKWNWIFNNYQVSLVPLDVYVQAYYFHSVICRHECFCVD